jgi:hypothetical protein
MYWNGKGQKRMDELLKLIKANMKEGADIAAIETLVKGLDVLAGVKTVEEAKELIEKTGLLKSATDSLVSIAVKSHDDKFTSDKLPGLLKAEGEKIRKEINPEESKEQKKIREQGEQIDALTATGKMSELKTSLQAKAKELDYSGDVELFLNHGEKAVSFLEKEAKRYKSSVDERVSSDIKKLYGDTKPKTSTVDPAKAIKRADFESMPVNKQREIAMDKDFTVVD